MDKALFDVKLLSDGTIFMTPQDAKAVQIAESVGFREHTVPGMYLGFDGYAVKSSAKFEYVVEG